jgi:hypothetical protein
MHSMKHKSSEVPLKTVNAIGVLDANGLHLSPVHSLQIIRPDMSYLDVPDPKAAAAAAAAAEGAADSLQPVRLTAASRRTVSPFLKKESYTLMQRQDESDAWVSLTVQNAGVRRTQH